MGPTDELPMVPKLPLLVPKLRLLLCWAAAVVGLKPRLLDDAAENPRLDDTGGKFRAAEV